MTIILAILAVVGLSACGKGEIKGAKNWPIADFTFTDNENNSLSLANLNGKVWVADFIYTNCPDVCLPMTFNMAKLQDLAKKEKIENIEFVSFSIDPEVDSPKVLTEYAKYFDVDFKNWHFLTGYKQEEIEKFAMDNFKTLVKKPENDPNVIHQTYFYLVNKEGKIMKLYSGLDDIPFDEIIKDIKTLQ
ncbi:SCO family protein [Cytobacillus depressus]|uniref:SCO family protein n=1 Tax=Cytobacillus depressus TaxID=1602942 RepID=A0A6L3VBI2_9BACI|nr:SCO family protein [Cytobacillus depressus]